MANEALLSERTKENVYHCNKCGLCMAVCPVYKELLLESAGPRARSSFQSPSWKATSN